MSGSERKASLIIFIIICASASSTENEEKPSEAIQSHNNRIFESHTYFDVLVKPMLANGHVGYVPFSDSIYMNALFNGYIKKSSHRARIPNFANIHFESCGSARTANKSRCLYTLDAQRALFQTNADFLDGNVTVEHIQYAHRYYDQVIVNTIKMKRKTAVANESFQLKLNRDWYGASKDLKLSDAIAGVIANREVVFLAATTQTAEEPIYQNETSKVFILYERIPKSIQIPPGQLNASFTWLTIVQHKADGIEALFQRLHANSGDILRTHTIEWSHFWEEHAISVDGDDELSKSIQCSLYAIASNMPSMKRFSDNGPFYGLSPSGLAFGGLNANYQGHSFWDTETWILPAALLIEPKWSQKLLNYRHIVRKAAHDRARDTGYKGLRFPWESAFTGAEATPDHATQNMQYEQHVTADIGNAVRSIFYATNDLEWMEDYGCELAIGTAEFWASRVTFNKSTNRFDINGVMGPDEDHWNINNNPFTNVVAALNLYFGTYASCLCGKTNVSKYPLNETWSEIASKIRLLYDPKLDYNPEFDGYNLSMKIKQADVTLLGYPLHYANIRASTRRNNLNFYENVTRPSGPAMTWSMHAIGHLDMGMAPTKQLFNRTYAPYIKKPFYVWSENAIGDAGAKNFLTGAGGFLQLIMYGYAGIRISAISMTITHPTLPPDTKQLKLKGISYMGLRFSLEIEEDKYRIELRGNLSNVRLYFDNVEYDISIEKQFELKRSQKLSIYPKKIEQIVSCPLPRDIIDEAQHR